MLLLTDELFIEISRKRKSTIFVMTRPTQSTVAFFGRSEQESQKLFFFLRKVSPPLLNRQKGTCLSLVNGEAQEVVS